MVVSNGYPLPYVRSVVVRTDQLRRRKWHGEFPTAPCPTTDLSFTTAIDNRHDRVVRRISCADSVRPSCCVTTDLD